MVRENQVKNELIQVHVDGDIYDGLWLEDMANGQGVYIHSGKFKFY